MALIKTSNAVEDLIENLLTRVRLVFREEIKAARVDLQPISAPVEELLNIDQAAALLSLSKQTIYALTSSRSIPHFKKGKRLYFRRTELNEWATHDRKKTQYEIQAESFRALRKGERP